MHGLFAEHQCLVWNYQVATCCLTEMNVLQSSTAFLPATQQSGSDECSGKRSAKAKSAVPAHASVPEQAAELVLQLLSLHSAMSKLVTQEGKPALPYMVVSSQVWHQQMINWSVRNSSCIQLW